MSSFLNGLIIYIYICNIFPALPHVNGLKFIFMRQLKATVIEYTQKLITRHKRSQHPLSIYDNCKTNQRNLKASVKSGICLAPILLAECNIKSVNHKSCIFLEWVEIELNED